MLIFTSMLYAQKPDNRQRFVATTEEEVFKILDQIIDSMLVSKQYINPEYGDDTFALGSFKEMSSQDTIMKIEQDSHFASNSIFIGDRFYRTYLSNCQSIAFYERLLNYFKNFKNIDLSGNYYLKRGAAIQLSPIRQILIKQYESGELNEKDKAEAFRLIEQTALWMINDTHNYVVLLKGYEKYITENIKQAIVGVIDNPFYPNEYLDFYMNLHISDTLSVVDTVGIADITKENIIKRRIHRLSKEEYENDYSRFSTYLHYKVLGEEWGGLSPGEAYLEEKRKAFPYKGYLDIYTIVEYAKNHNDTLLIEHLKAFKKKHPDYPLKYF